MSVSEGVLDHFNIRTRKPPDHGPVYERDILGLREGRPAELCLPRGMDVTSEGKPVGHLG